MEPIVFYSENLDGRDFVIGDIHGCYSTVLDLMRYINFRPHVDRLFCVGDLIDRGPNSISCLELLRMPWFFSCRGNHEQILIDYLKDPDNNEPNDITWLRKSFKTFTERQHFAGYWLSILERLPYVISVGSNDNKFYVVHAEILEQKRSVTENMIDNMDFQDMGKSLKRFMWGRSLITAFENDKPVLRAHDKNLPLIYCGHTILKSPTQIARQIYLDGGAYIAYNEEKRLEYKDVVNPRLRIIEPKTGKCWSLEPSTSDFSIDEIWTPITK